MNPAAATTSREPERSEGTIALPRGDSRGFFNRRNLILCGLLVAATLCVYVQVRGFQFIIVDDDIYVEDNEHVRDGISPANLRWAFTTLRDGNWFPLTWISLMVDASAYGTWAGGYHITNLILHAANVLLVFATFSKMTRNVLPSALVAALFAIHPLHVQSVAWVAERKDVLSMFFGLCALYAYVCYAQNGRARGLLVSVLLFLCSLCAKQTLVTLPFVLLLIDYWPLGRLRLWRPLPSAEDSAVVETTQAADSHDAPGPVRAPGLKSLLVEKIPFFVLSAVFCVVATVAQSRAKYVLSLEMIPFGTRILNAVVVYWLYLQKALFPVGLVIYYPHPGSRLGQGDVAFALVFLLGVTTLAVANIRKRPYLLIGWLWYLGTLVPMIGLVQIGGQQMADRYTYFPLLGCYLVVVWLGASLAKRLEWRPLALRSIAAAVVIIYGSVAFVQASYWHDSISLLRHAVVAGEETPYCLTMLGWSYVNAKRFREAVRPVRRAIELNPDFEPAQFLLGCVLQKDSKFDEAAEHFRAALATDDEKAVAHLNLGTCLLALRDYGHARWEFERVVELEPDNARAQSYLADLSLQLHKYDEAIAHARRALELDPSQTQCRQFIVVALRDQGRLDEAIEQLRQLVAAAPDDSASQRELQRLLAQRASKSTTASP